MTPGVVRNRGQFRPGFDRDNLDGLEAAKKLGLKLRLQLELAAPGQAVHRHLRRWLVQLGHEEYREPSRAPARVPA